MKTLLTLIIFFLSTAFSQVFSQGSGYALNFNGTSDYVHTNFSSSVNYSEFTFEAWVKIPHPGSVTYHPIFSIGASAASDIEVYVQRNTNRLIVTTNRSQAGFGFTGYVFPNDELIHLTVTVSSGVKQVYYNGILQTSVTSAGTQTAPNIIANPELTVGTTLNHTSGFTSTNTFCRGTIDEVRFWNKALTPTEIRTNMCQKLSGSEPNLVVYYRMDEGADNTCSGGEDVCDITGNGYHGTKF